MTDITPIVQRVRDLSQLPNMPMQMRVILTDVANTLITVANERDSAHLTLQQERQAQARRGPWAPGVQLGQKIVGVLTGLALVTMPITFGVGLWTHDLRWAIPNGVWALGVLAWATWAVLKERK
jgi:hypothetical protein